MNHPLRVLVVDDCEDVRFLVIAILRGGDFAVTAVESGVDALEAVDSATFDVILLDMMMPGMSGAEVATEIRRRRLTTPVVLFSALHDVSSEADRLGLTHFCQKPCSPGTLGPLLQRAAGVGGWSGSV